MKKYNLTVKLGQYTNNQGEQKNKWINVGVMIEQDDGGRYILLNRTFNPAGVPNQDARENIMVSIFEEKPKQTNPEDVDWEE